MMTEIQANPYTKIIIEDFATANDKLLAMSQEEGFNRMKVGECFSVSVKFCIYRTGINSFDMDSVIPIRHMNKNKKKFKNLTSDDVVELIGEHNILAHELFELTTASRTGKDQHLTEIRL